ncbi:hypothetical protein HMPREF9999_01634 [Alloprevotella sp. oral taxon 473 str. F0040]|nr:hypothetical protein HMPREF9999_01634 [Alloprevotella sp. oral taxon 473 str. F0040]
MGDCGISMARSDMCGMCKCLFDIHEMLLGVHDTLCLNNLQYEEEQNNDVRREIN